MASTPSSQYPERLEGFPHMHALVRRERRAVRARLQAGFPLRRAAKTRRLRQHPCASKTEPHKGSNPKPKGSTKRANPPVVAEGARKSGRVRGK